MFVSRMEIETLNRFSSADKVSGKKAECFQTRKAVSYAMRSDTNQEHAWQELEILALEHDFRGRFTEEVITSLNEHYSEVRAAHRGCRSLIIPASHGADHVALRGGIDAVVKAMRCYRSGASCGYVQVVGCGTLCSFAQHKENVCGSISEQIGAMVDAVVYPYPYTVQGCLPESQGQNMVLTVLCVPSLLDSGSPNRRTRRWERVEGGGELR